MTKTRYAALWLSGNMDCCIRSSLSPSVGDFDGIFGRSYKVAADVVLSARTLA